MRQAHVRPSLLWPLIAVVVILGALAAGAARAQDAQTAPALTREQQAEFLRTADVVANAAVSTGVTKPQRLTLTANGITHDALFQAIDKTVPIQRFPNGRTELNFRDSYHFNIAAYQLAEILGLADMVPVTVERTWESRKGSLSWWIDSIKWDETRRMKEEVRPPDAVDWGKQQNRMRVFSELVYDTDRNTGNQLIAVTRRGEADEWRLWMIDFTRAFRLSNSLFREENVQRCDREVLGRLKTLTAEAVTAATRPHLQPGEIKSLIKRRDRLVARIERLAKERGESLVLY